MTFAELKICIVVPGGGMTGINDEVAYLRTGTAPMGYSRVKLEQVFRELEANAVAGATGELDRFVIAVLRTMAGD